MKNKVTEIKEKGDIENYEKELKNLTKETKSIRHNSVVLASKWSSDLINKNQQKLSDKNSKLST